MRKFKVRLQPGGPGGAWTFFTLPFGAEKEFGSKARIAVAGTMNKFPFQNSLMPVGDGTHVMMVNKALQAGAKAASGDLVSVELEVDRSKRSVVIPIELKRALIRNKKAMRAFNGLSYSHRKEFAEWIASAKRDETRLARAEKA